MLHHRQKIFEKLRTRKGEKIIFFDTSFFIFYYVWVSFPSQQVLFYKSYTDSWQKIIRMMSSFFFLRCWTNLLCDQTRPYILIEVQMNISVLVRKLSLNSYNIKLSAFLRPISVLNFFIWQSVWLHYYQRIFWYWETSVNYWTDIKNGGVSMLI